MFLLSFGGCLIGQESISFSRERGYFNVPFQLELSSPVSGANIYYTLDGTEPTIGNSIRYTEPISISNTISLKVILENNDEVSKSITSSYIYIPELLSSKVLDKGITESKKYKNKIESSFKALPVVLIHTDAEPQNLIEQDIPASAEIIWPDLSQTSIQVNCGIQTWGASPSNPKKNYRLEFRDSYGPKKLKADLFKVDNYNTIIDPIDSKKSFKNLLLRAGSQDALNAEFGNENLAQYVRNRVNYDIQMHMGYKVPHGRFVHVFFNNEYLGQYHLLERVDAAFLEDYHGGKESKYEVYKSGKILNGPVKEVEQSEWSKLEGYVNFSSLEAMKETNKKINLISAADYLILMAYSSGHDWGSHSNCLAYTNLKSKKSGYHFLIHDTDFSFGNGGSWHPEYSGQIDYFRAPLIDDGPVPDNLIQELEFKILLMDRFQLHCYNNGILTPDRLKTLYSSRIQQVKESLIAESARWGSYVYNYAEFHVASDMWDVDDEFNAETKRVLNKFIPERTDEMISYFRDNKLISSLQAAKLKFNVKKQLLQIKNPNRQGTIYYTLDGSDPRLFGGGISPSALPYQKPLNIDQNQTIKMRIVDTAQPMDTIDRWSAIITFRS